MESALETLTINEAAIVAGVTVAKINRMIDKRILPKELYKASPSRTVRKDACLWIAFYFETEDVLTAGARVKAIRNALAYKRSWTELRECRFEEARAVQILLAPIWDDVTRGLSRLKEAQGIVVEDPEILGGTPVIRGTRIPVYDVASLVEGSTPRKELKKIYPMLTLSQIELAWIYAKANPQRGRPRHRHLPENTRSKAVRKQAQMLIQAKREILSSGEFLPVTQNRTPGPTIPRERRWLRYSKSS
jgi:uncharacterized protein (DUF433 family)